MQNLAAAEDLLTLLNTMPSSKDMEVYKADLALVRERLCVFEGESGLCVIGTRRI